MKAVDRGACEPLTLAIDDGRYPPLLREIHDPPALLYLRGDVAALQQPQIAIVGSRNASSAGLRLAVELAAQLSAAGLCVCSGLALGIDGAAHRGALGAGGASVAVMATGIDTVYPRRHLALAQTMVDQGCLITEFEPGMPPLRENFPRRNRIISGLSLGVLVVEAAPGSGSLITARSALEQGREVFALPWSTLHPGGRGCLQLLRDGAKMVEGVDDVLEELGALYAVQCRGGSASAHGPGGADPPSPLLRLLGFEAMGVDQLVEDSGRPISKVLAELADLELSGHVMRVAGGYVRR